jgi:hypothetical protein
MFSFEGKIEMKRAQWLNLLEAGIIFSSIMLYIWRLRYTTPRSWIVILGCVILSHLVRREHSDSVGFRWNNFRECLDRLAPVLLLITLTLVSIGVLCATMRRITLEQALLSWLFYCPWGLFQQYLLNGYLANRLLAFLPASRVPLINAFLFCGAHSPNWFLMLATFATGYLSTRVFMKYRNLYFLGLAHGLIGTLLFIVIPDSISHHLTVGPGFFLR